MICDHHQDETYRFLGCSVLGWLVAGCYALWSAIAIAALLLLSGCAEYPVTGSITYRDPDTGAKGGLVFSPGEPPTASIRVPVYDDETGELIGLAELEMPTATVVPEK